MRLDAMYAEERRVDAILQAKQRDLLALHDQMGDEDDRARREFDKHQHDLEAFQAVVIASTMSIGLVSSIFKEKKETSRLSSLAEELKMREFNLPRVTSSSATIPPETFLPRRLVPRLHQLQLPQPISRPQSLDKVLDFHNASSLVAFPAPTQLSIQSRLLLHSACSLSYQSIVVPRPKLPSTNHSLASELSRTIDSLGRSTTRRQFLLRDWIAMNALRSNPTSVVTRISSSFKKLLATGNSLPRGRLFPRSMTTWRQVPRLTAPESSSMTKLSS